VNTSQNSTDRLATTVTFREQIRVRPARLIARLSSETVRLEAAQALCADARRKPAWLYEWQGDTPKRRPIDQIEFDAIQDGISEGYITERHLAEYFAEKFLIHAASIAVRRQSNDVSFCATVKEAAEALEEIAVARALPTPENRRSAAREGVQGALALLAHSTELHRGSAA
jgi:hypothetical protein